MFILTTAAGAEVGFYAGSLAEAIPWARKQLEDDPEAGTLELYEVGREDSWKHRRTITFGPDADWQSVIVVLEPGEKVEAPRMLPLAVDAGDAYEIGDPKHPRFHDVMSEVWDSREKM